MLVRLVLTDFRNHEALSIAPGPGFVVLTGENGAGKTNILEAVSLLAPGRGLRRAALGEMARQGGSGGFGVAADLAVTHIGTAQPAARCSTGEQKALLLGLILAHADLVAERTGAPPVLLLDEVAAHLDPRRRAALFDRLAGKGQVWMTGTEAALFTDLGVSAFRMMLGGAPAH